MNNDSQITNNKFKSPYLLIFLKLILLAEDLFHFQNYFKYKYSYQIMFK